MNWKASPVIPLILTPFQQMTALRQQAECLQPTAAPAVSGLGALRPMARMVMR
jgi:hypothetical protein